MINYIPVIDNYVVATRAEITVQKWPYLNCWDILVYMIFLGSLIMFVRLMVHFISLQRYPLLWYFFQTSTLVHLVTYIPLMLSPNPFVLEVIVRLS